MFRFSIRELVLLTLVVAMGVAWFLEHRRQLEADARARYEKKRADTGDELLIYQSRQIMQIETQLLTRDIEVAWVRDGERKRPVVCYP
jgi:hypothetical protein